MTFCPISKQQCFVEKADEDGRSGDTCTLWDDTECQCAMRTIAARVYDMTDPERGLTIRGEVASHVKD